jgi:chemotaxis protein methyltransferase CheR
MGYRWPGYRKVRGQVCKRVGRRLKELGLTDLEAYQVYLGAHPEEWSLLDGFCRITISRFFRDRKVYETLGGEVLPELARQAESNSEPVLRIWSAGCGAGEEPYSISMLCRLSDNPGLQRARVRILATDSDEHQLDRARTAIYPVGCTKDMPVEIRDSAFERLDQDQLLLREPYREGIEFACQDLRQDMPEGPFHLILCRNLTFTYFIEDTQREILAALHQRLLPGGYLVLGAHEQLPPGGPPFEALPHCPSIVRRVDS